MPDFQGNPLIEALPPMLSEEELLSTLMLLPSFDSEQRTWSTSERLMLLKSLSNFMVPLKMQLDLCRTLDSMLRTGYVGRAPATPGHSRIFQSIYERQHQGVPFRQSATTLTPQFSSSLIGISGMGKSTTVERWCRHMPQVIYHPEYNLYQITYLHIEMPSDGTSIKGLAHAILHQIDALIPGANYFREYAQNGKTGADALMRAVARVMNMHLVGILICDEVQNLVNARKGTDVVMTELVSAANELRLPILFIGTNKAARILSHDFRQARRSTGHGLTPWDRLHRGNTDKPSEWDEFLGTLWSYQWVKNPAPLDAIFHDQMYEYSQGVIDLAIKLFAASQARAVSDGTETLTHELLEHVYQDGFKLMHPMIGALRDNDLEALALYGDIAPIDLGQFIDSMARRVRAAKSPLYSVKGTDTTYKDRVALSMTSLGLPADEAIQAAEAYAAKHPNATLLNGAGAVLSQLTLPKPIPKKNSKRKPDPFPVDGFDACPADYRRAVLAARHGGTGVMDQLIAFGMAPTLDSIVKI